MEGIELSRDGARNAYTFACQRVGHWRNYSVCLNLIKKQGEGKLNTIYADCGNHIGRGHCPAVSMREQEVAAGKPMFFVERMRGEIKSVVNVSAYKPVMAQVKVTAPVYSPKRTPERTVKVVRDEEVGTDFADLVNVMKKSEVAAPIQAPVATIKNSAVSEVKRRPQPGESLVEFAKRVMRGKQ